MKAWAAKFYGSVAWHDCRDGFLASKHWLCERCVARGDAVPAKIAHHVIELTPENINDPMVTLNWENLEALCQDCHNREHHGTGMPRRYRFDENGNVLPEMECAQTAVLPPIPRVQPRGVSTEGEAAKNRPKRA